MVLILLNKIFGKRGLYKIFEVFISIICNCFFLFIYFLNMFDIGIKYIFAQDVLSKNIIRRMKKNIKITLK